MKYILDACFKGNCKNKRISNIFVKILHKAIKEYYNYTSAISEVKKCARNSTKPVGNSDKLKVWSGDYERNII